MKHFFLSFSLVVLSGAIFAKPVTIQTAQTVGANFISRKVGNATLTLTNSIPSNTVTGQTSFYIFDVNNGNGFVIVSGEDAVTPILGYSTQNVFPQQITNKEVAYWMDGYNQQISNVITNQLTATSAVAASWSSLLSNAPNNNTAAKPTDVSPMITTTWDQMDPYSSTDNTLYNNLCPTATPTGCVATAMAQIMNYWGSPTKGTGSHSYSTSTVGGTLSANFDTTYDWANMPTELHSNSTTAQKNAVALLMYNCGVSVNMDYNTAANDGSGAYVISYTGQNNPCSQVALKTYFGYSDSIKGLQRANYTDAVWIPMLQAELNAGRPILYTGAGSVGGHAFDFDGYETSGDMFHINWGWSGQSNGYFTIDNLDPSALGVGGGGGNFNSDQEALINIHPAASSIMPNLVVNAALTTPQPSITVGAPFTVTTNIKNTGTGGFTNGSFVGGIYNAAGTTIVGYTQTLTNQTLASGDTMTVTFSTPGIAAMTAGYYIVQVLYKDSATSTTWTPISNGISPTNTNTMTIHVTAPTGINQVVDANNISVFPNPAKDFITVDWKLFNGNVKGIQMFNIIGQRVLNNEVINGKNVSVPVNQLSGGTYILNVITDQGTVSKKISIQ